MSEREFGLGRGKVFPADHARRLLNPGRRLIQSPRRAVARMEIAPDAKVLELGCGPGYFSPELRRAVPRGHLVLFDLQRAMLELARSRTGASSVTCVQGDAMRLPFADGRFDAVLIVTVLGEVPDASACVREVRRVLRTGGSVTFSETRTDSDFVALPDLRRLVEPEGFSLASRHGRRLQYTVRFETSGGSRTGSTAGHV